MSDNLILTLRINNNISYEQYISLLENKKNIKRICGSNVYVLLRNNKFKFIDKIRQEIWPDCLYVSSYTLSTLLLDHKFRAIDYIIRNKLANFEIGNLQVTSFKSYYYAKSRHLKIDHGLSIAKTIAITKNLEFIKYLYNKNPSKQYDITVNSKIILDYLVEQNAITRSGIIKTYFNTPNLRVYIILEIKPKYPSLKIIEYYEARLKLRLKWQAAIFMNTIIIINKWQLIKNKLWIKQKYLSQFASKFNIDIAWHIIQFIDYYQM